MRTIWLLFALAGVLCAGQARADSVTYMGMLTGGDGGGLSISSVGPGRGWLSSTTSLSWRVDNTTTPGWWHYEYTIVVPDAQMLWTDIQCVIVETSPTFETGSLRPDSVSSEPENWLVGVEIGRHTTALNPGLWNSIYGIRFCTGVIDPTTLTINFDSDRAPIWGDFYARSFIVNGEFNALRNSGLGWPTDTDPSAPPGDGSVNNHVLVPDTQEIPPEEVIPAPGAMLLGFLGASLTGLLRRKRLL